MFDPVGTTSWHNRHAACLCELNELLLREPADERTILIVGPGAVTRVAGLLLNDAAVQRPSRLRKLIGDAARYGDQLLRRFPLMPLQSLEPLEVESALRVPHRLIVVDRSPRVLKAVRAAVPAARCLCLDISSTAPPESADVVIAFNVICRLDDPAAGMANLVSAVRPGGWLVIDDRSAADHLRGREEFTQSAPKIHRRRAEQFTGAGPAL